MANSAVDALASSAFAPGSRDGHPGDLVALWGGADGPEPFGRLASMVRFAVEDDDAGRLVDVAAAELGAPLGLAAITGERLAHAPDDAPGRQALAVARGAARQPGANPPSGWRLLPIV